MFKDSEEGYPLHLYGKGSLIVKAIDTTLLQENNIQDAESYFLKIENCKIKDSNRVRAQKITTKSLA